MQSRSYNLILIRHGETASNKEHRYLGITEEPLSTEGKERLQERIAQGIYPRLDKLFVSPMRRCIETAELMYPELERTVVDSWKEMNFGDFEGKNYVELQEDLRYQAWIESNGTLPFPNGESQEAFISRVWHGMNQMVESLIGDGKVVKEQETVGIIAHGGTIMAMLSRIVGGEYFDYHVANGEGYQCELIIDEDKLQIEDLERIFK